MMQVQQQQRPKYPVLHQQQRPQQQQQQYSGHVEDWYLEGGFRNRILLALESQLPNEVDWAFNKLIRLCARCPENFSLACIPGIVEALIRHSQAFVRFAHPLTRESNNASNNVLGDLFNGGTTRNGGGRLSQAEVERTLQIFHIFRNFSFVEPNVPLFLHKEFQLSRLLVLGLHTQSPSLKCALEIQHYCMDTLENLSVMMKLTDGVNDPVFVEMLQLVHSNDRFMVLGALRTLTRLVRIEANEQAFVDVHVPTMQRMFQIIFAWDEDLVAAVLDFLYQYTSLYDNVTTQIAQSAGANIVKVLLKFISWRTHNRPAPNLRHQLQYAQVPGQQMRPPTTYGPPQQQMFRAANLRNEQPLSNVPGAPSSHVVLPSDQSSNQERLQQTPEERAAHELILRQQVMLMQSTMPPGMIMPNSQRQQQPTPPPAVTTYPRLRISPPTLPQQPNATANTVESNSICSRFLNEICESSPDTVLEQDHLYARYLTFQVHNKATPMKLDKFKDCALQSLRGITAMDISTNSGTKRCFKGVRVKDNYEESSDFTVSELGSGNNGPTSGILRIKSTVGGGNSPTIREEEESVAEEQSQEPDDNDNDEIDVDGDADAEDDNVESDMDVDVEESVLADEQSRSSVIGASADSLNDMLVETKEMAPTPEVVLRKCGWADCEHAFKDDASTQEVYDHVEEQHLKNAKVCCWKSCMRFSQDKPAKNFQMLAAHFKTHEPYLVSKNSTNPQSRPPPMPMPQPINHDQSSIPLTAALILRNLARAKENNALFGPYESMIASLAVSKDQFHESVSGALASILAEISKASAEERPNAFMLL